MVFIGVEVVWSKKTVHPQYLKYLYFIARCKEHSNLHQGCNTNNTASDSEYKFENFETFYLYWWHLILTYFAALGKIGVLNEAVKETLLWAVRYEEKAAVRAEACHSIILLNITDIDVLDVLQDRLLVETSELVRK